MRACARRCAQAGLADAARKPTLGATAQYSAAASGNIAGDDRRRLPGVTWSA
jgi:hypothetical protein